MAKPNANNSNADKRFFFVSVAIFVLISIFALYTVLRRNTPAAENTPPPTVIAGLGVAATQLPAPVPAAGDFTEQVQRIAKMVEACPDYGDERRTQMKLHIGWLLAPDTIPEFMKIPLGSNPTGRLIEGMATYTSSEWGLHNKAPNSCLLPIGRQLNAMLVANGTEPLSVFQ